jgi:hypothetical protein
VKHHVRVREWDEGRARRHVPLPLLAEFEVEAPTITHGHGDVDGARRVVRDELGKRYPNRVVRGLNALVGGGWSAIVSLPEV